MIIYNIRNNGPYEYEKFILNIGQIYNLIYDLKKEYANHEIHSILDNLNQEIKNLTAHDSISNKLVLLDILKKDKR